MSTITKTANATSKSTAFFVSSLFIAIFFFSFSFQAKAEDGTAITFTVDIKSYNGSPLSCYGSKDAELTILATGGKGDYSYSINQGSTYQKSNIFSNLEGAHNYIVIVKDSKGTLSATQWIWVGTVSNPVTLNVHYVSNATCSNPDGGYIDASAWGGTGSITYSIDNGATFQTSGLYKNLHAGTYNIIARDANGCNSVVKTTTVGGSYTATISGDTTIMSGNMTKLYINIDGVTNGQKNLYTASYKNNSGETFTINNLKAGLNEISTKNIENSCIYTLVKVVSQSNCLAYVSGTATITIDNKIAWLGKSNDWNDAQNWYGGKIPGANTDVLISLQNQNPVISSNDAYARNIEMESGTSLTIDGNTLHLPGDITSEDGAVNAKNGTIEYIGTEMQRIHGSIFRNNDLFSMIINNSSKEGVVLSADLNIYGSVNFSGTNRLFNTNDFLTVKSNIDGTAMVGPVVENTISGKVTVEHYLPKVKKRWEFLSIPTKPGQTINDAWQEGQPANDPKSISGYGIQLTGEMSDWDKKGFDRKSASPSIKVYNEDKNNWAGITSTLAPFSDRSSAYMVFVRGDRSANTTNAAPTETVLRTKGELKTGDQEVITVPPGKFAAVGNPYAAPIDLSKIESSRKMIYYIWDSKLGTSYGAYQTIRQKKNGTFQAIPGGGTYKVTPQNIVNSGHAFFVYNKKGGTIQITEAAKEVGESITGKSGSFSTNVNARGDGNGERELIVNLYSITNGIPTLVDGILQSFSDDYNTEIDENDAVKSPNSTENLSIRSNDQLLAFETRPFSTIGDTTFLSFTGMGYLNYRFEIEMENLPENQEVFLYDNYTKKVTPITAKGSSTYEFTIINNSGSWASNRFMIIFRPLAILPVNMVNVKAEVKNNDVIVSWNVEEQKNVKSYEVERSTDGNNFSKIGTVNAANTNDYSFTDVNAVSGTNYYRIVSVDIDGKKGISTVVKAIVNNSTENISVSPNPIAGNNVHLKLNIQAKGMYYISIKNQLGQIIDSRQVNFDANQRNLDINPSTKLNAGVYSIEVINPSGDHSVIQFIK